MWAGDIGYSQLGFALARSKGLRSILTPTDKRKESLLEEMFLSGGACKRRHFSARLERCVCEE
jgi:hypothetical protein